jgi:ketosteroid isomerase-like protein
VIPSVDKKDKKSASLQPPADAAGGNPELDEFFRSLKAGAGRPKQGSDGVAAALDAAQRFATEQDVEDAAADVAQDLSGDSGGMACSACGYRNREGNKFCGMCGALVSAAEKSSSTALTSTDARPLPAIATTSNAFPEHMMREAATRPTGNETHHYHHHYHHHYFPGAQEGSYPRGGEPVRDVARDDKLRSATMALRGDLSRAEAAVRAITQEWVLACNTKHLDDLLELYVSDALVLRSNCSPIRGAVAVREFFFGALDAGLGEVEMEPLRIEVVGDFAYEAGRCKALIPTSTGKRREERGKYLWVCARQTNSEWKLIADCWSSDLTLGNLESEIPSGIGVKTSSPRKGS